MEIRWFKHLPSTHNYLKELIKSGAAEAPIAIGADFQSDGVGSRGNSWLGEEGNLYLSFCMKQEQLPEDLKLESISIYFSYLSKEVLYELGSKVWIKWPNDFYLNNSKVGGVITTKIKDTIIGSIGLNILHSPLEFAALDVDTNPRELTKLFLEKLTKKLSWKNVFSKYKIEFQNSLDFTFHIDGIKRSLRDAKLLEDGSIEIQNKKVYSLR